MSFFIKDIVNGLENAVPLNLQENWDNSGYQLKLDNEPVTGVLTSLDLTPAAVSLAIKRKCNLIIIHHPFFFSPVKSISINSQDSQIIFNLIKNRICVYAMHTNFDSSYYSMSKFIAEKIGLISLSPLKPHKKTYYKLSVFIPKGYVAAVRQVLFDTANPQIGNYENCSFETKGKGSFKPLTGANPFIGEKETISFADESKLELIVSEDRLPSTIEEMKKVHPYEEVAYDVYPLFNYGGKDLEGIGIIGNFNHSIKFKDLLKKLNKLIKPAYINYCGNMEKPIKKAAIVSGSGFSFIDETIKQNSDVLISSECSHDKALKAIKNGLCLIDMPHFDTEKYFISLVKQIIENKFDIKIIENDFDVNPIFNFKEEES
jgi:dinuclear metal center YbgI/SA1388 family protein